MSYVSPVKKSQTYDDILKQLQKKLKSHPMYSIRQLQQEEIDTVQESFITPDEHSWEDDNKPNCIVLTCQEEATVQLDLHFGEYGSTLFSYSKIV